MSFGLLALVLAISLVGPLLFVPRWARLPVVVGELLAGIALGRTGLGWLDSTQPTFAFLAQIGFALVMFVAGTHVPLRDAALRPALVRGAARACLVAALAIPAGWLIARAFGTGHAWLYAVILASSSAALALPILRSASTGRPVLELIVQIAVADTLCLIALPLALRPADAPRVAVGVGVVAVAAFAFFLIVRWGERSGLRRRVHRVSEDNLLAVEIRVVLAGLFALGAVAVLLGVSIMLAGFLTGLAISAVGEPRRVARQVFAITEGFFAPVFFIWFGAQLDLRSVTVTAVGLGLVLGAAAVACHLAGVLTKQPWSLAGLAGAQLGVPVAAMAEAGRANLLAPGEDGALLLGAVVTLAVVALASRRVAAAGTADTVGGTRHNEAP